MPAEEISAGVQQVIAMGAYLCIFLDGVYVNTEKYSDNGYMGQENVVDASSTNVEISLCLVDGTALLIGWPYDEIYRWYLEMKIDDANGEMTKYNNSAAKYNTYYQAYQNAYNRAHMPKGEAAYFRL